MRESRTYGSVRGGYRKVSVYSIIGYLIYAMQKADAMVYVFDDNKGTLGFTRSLSCLEMYGSKLLDLDLIFEKIDMEVKRRRIAMDTPESVSTDTFRPIILLLHNSEAPERISNDAGMLQNYKEYMKSARELGIAIIYTNLENRKISYSDPAVWKTMTDSRHFMMFERLDLIRLWDVSLAEKKRLSGKQSNDTIIVNWDGNTRKMKPVIIP